MGDRDRNTSKPIDKLLGLVDPISSQRHVPLNACRRLNSILVFASSWIYYPVAAPGMADDVDSRQHPMAGIDFLAKIE